MVRSAVMGSVLMAFIASLARAVAQTQVTININTAASTGPVPSNVSAGDSLLYNQVQFIGTFQSAHVAPPEPIIDLLNTAPYQASFSGSANVPQSYFFSHLTISEQLAAGIRGFEFEVADDPQGGRYAYSAGLKLAGETNTLISPDLQKPGIKAISGSDFDIGSTCYLLSDCFQAIANFSAANPTHFPITVFVHHTSTANASTFLGSAYSDAAANLMANPNVMPTNFTTAVNANLSDVEALIQQIFTTDQYFTPDNLRAMNNASGAANLRDIVLPGGVLNGSWPTVGDLRGKIIFVADPDYLDTLEALHPNATASILWPADDNGDSDPNVVILDGEVDLDLYNLTSNAIDTNADTQSLNGAYGIQFMALQGFVIRGGVDQPDQGALDYTLRSQLFKSIGGAQFLSTFFEVPSPTNLQPSTYSVNPNNQFAGSQAECNPVTVGSAVTVGSVAYPYDGAFPQLGGVNVLQPPLPECPVPNGFGIM